MKALRAPPAAPSVTHAYDGTGDYVAALQVCDKDGVCDPTSGSFT